MPQHFTQYKTSILLVCAAACFVSMTNGCKANSTTPSDNRSGLVIGTFTSFKIIDGDTFTALGLDRSIRFLGLDTEETPKKRTALLEVNHLKIQWPEIYWNHRRSSRFPVKYNSPFGYQTMLWAKQWFADVDSVRLERDTPDEVYGYYGRYLAYIIAFKKGKALNYNIECVRNGFSPYSGKYGFSTRFHAEFLAAQEEARVKKVGIWNANSMCYPDYKERFTWWNARGKAIQQFRELYAKNPSFFSLGKDGELERLGLSEGRIVTVFASLGTVYQKNFPHLIELRHKNKQSAWIIFFEDMAEMYEKVNWKAFDQMYVYVRGRVKIYKGKIEIQPGSASDISLHPPSLP